MATADDHRFMGRALELARRGLYTCDPNPRVGCVIVRDGEIVGEGWHEAAGGPHAEIVALEQAGPEHARGATVYVTLEPCCHHGRTPPCTTALVEAGVARVVAAMEDPNPRVAGQGLAALREAGIAVESGVAAEAAARLNPGFIKRMRRGRPFVRAKLAMSLDGRTALASGESRWITSEQARADVHRLRARSSAVMTGVGTVLADDPALTARVEGAVRQPLRVVVDTHLSTPDTAALLRQPGDTVIFTCREPDGYHARLAAAGAEVVTLPARGDRVDLAAVLEELARREVNEVLLEMGATLAGAMLRQGLVDEMVIYMAPVLLGDAARPLFRLPGIEHMDQRLELEIDEIRAVGPDWRITARPKSGI